MVKLNLVEIDNENQVVYYDCYPEGKEKDAFRLGLNPKEKKIVSNSLGQKNAYVAHAAWRIYDIFEETQKLPQHATSGS